MAYIIGLVTKEERVILEKRGWEIEKTPDELIPTEELVPDTEMVTIWVDACVLEIMSGPDWDVTEPEEEKRDEATPP